MSVLFDTLYKDFQTDASNFSRPPSSVKRGYASPSLVSTPRSEGARFAMLVDRCRKFATKGF